MATAHTPSDATLFIGSGLETPAELVTEFSALDLTRRPSEQEAVSALAETMLATTGHFAVVVVGETKAFLATDFLGSTPLFGTSTGGGLVIGTNLADVAERGGRRDLDEASAEEYLLTGVVTHPFTVLEGVYRFEPGCLVAIEKHGQELQSTTHPYWLPSPPQRGMTRDDERYLAQRFREELIDVLGRIQVSRVSVLLSGGEDSRILAAMAKRAGHGVQGLIFLDALNREYRKASRAADLLDIDLVPRFRDPGHYSSKLSEVLHDLGLDMDPRQAHSFGLVDARSDPVPVIDGWYAALSKGNLSPHSTPKWRGIAVGASRSILPARRDHSSDGLMRHGTELRKRREHKAARLSHLDDAALAEWIHQWPATDQATVAFFLSNQRNAWSLSPFLFRPLVDLASSIPASSRLNRTFVKAAFSRSLGLAGLVPRTDGEVLGLPTALDVPCAALHQVAHRILRRFERTDRTADPGPWQSVAATWQADLDVLLACPPEALRAVANTSPAAAGVIDLAQLREPATLQGSIMRLRCAFLAHHVARMH